jgi:peptidoglycan/LPS O-acetylase OafA/YrhL
MPTSRQHYVDWLRVLAVLLLFPFHTLRVYNFGEDFYVKGPHLSRAAGWVLEFIDTWHMPLLFFLAGVSTCLALSRRTRTQYTRERGRRLLVPLLFGWVVLIPPQTWYGARFNSGYSESFFHYLVSGDFLQNNIRDGGDYYGGLGLGHLWFILFLLAISMIVLPLWGRSDRSRRFQGRVAAIVAHPAGWALVAFMILLSEAVPEVAGKGFVYYLVFFVLGYLAMVSPSFGERAERHAWWALPVGVVAVAWWISVDAFRDSLADPSWGLLGVNLIGFGARWLVIVGCMGLGRRYLNQASGSLAYLAEGSYPVYLLHQTVIVILGFSLVRLDTGWPLQWLGLLVASVATTFLVYEGVRRVAWLRFLFGLRPRRAVAIAPVGDRPEEEAGQPHRESVLR